MNNVIEYVTCPRCGNRFDDNFRKCPKCKAKNLDMICRGCGAQIVASEKRCPYCGKRHRKRRSVVVQLLLGVLLTILAIFTLLIALAFIFGSKSSSESSASAKNESVAEERNTRADKAERDKILVEDSEADVFDATGYVFISADRILEFGAYMPGERVITEVKASNVSGREIKSLVTDEDSFVFDLIFDFDSKVKDVSKDETVVIAGTITKPSSNGKTITLKKCYLVPDESYELRDDTQKQQEHCEALKQEVLDAEAAVIEQKKNSYIADCEELSYSAVSRDPDDYEGKKVVITGTVIQVQEGFFDSVTLRVETADGIWYVTYTRAEGESRILEDDQITCYGECKGVETYVALLGNAVTIPSMRMEYYDLQIA